ncbi:hypothetical protein BA895_09275 [Humibacillus sp. DSM 29435]|uniref:hypothetical protein n=1 Tax=Humibacillus sp. DSM 29435 TaxID=1869167 RepID=UPI000872090E|nr:hypothetical protein [Humibacillus sp. DSM 29435]OFE14544.1 hypothetical protein BA895_09275 [Humibacillus sp. DSM 29435]
MFITLITETGPGRGFPVQGLITLLVVAVIFYPVQKKVREVARRRRRERWAQEGLLTQEELHGDDELSPGGPEQDSPPVANPTQPPPAPPGEDRPA